MRSFVQACESRRLLSAGSLDLTYGNGTGIGTDKLPSGTLVVHETAVQPGARILVAGTFTPEGGSAQNFLARYTADGTRDKGFVGTTTVAANPRGLDSIDLMATQADGTILLLDQDAGLIQIVRLTASGKVDSTFGNKGVAKVTFSTARNMSIGPDGRIIVVGDDTNNVQVARLTSAGALDTTFASGGIFTGQLNLAGTNSPNATYTRSGLFADETSTGEVFVAGSFDFQELSPASTFSHPFVARLTTTGALDSTLNSNGTVEITNQGNVTLKGFAIQFSDECVISYDGSSFSSLQAINIDGSNDASFGDSGIVSVGGASSGIAIQSDNRILVREPSQFVRYESNGDLDNSFTDGVVPNAETFAGFGSDGSILTTSVSHKQAVDPFGYTIHPTRRWSEQASAGLLAANDVVAATNPPYRFSIQWRAEFGVAVKSLANPSIQIVGPSGATYKATFLGTTKPGNGTQRTANYKFAPPGGSWDSSDDGIYTVRMIPGVIQDANGSVATNRDLGQFVVQV